MPLPARRLTVPTRGLAQRSTAGASLPGSLPWAEDGLAGSHRSWGLGQSPPDAGAYLGASPPFRGGHQAGGGAPGGAAPVPGEGAPLSSSLAGLYGSGVPAGREWEVARAALLASGAAGEAARGAVPSLQTLCQRSVAEHLVEPRTALQLLEYAELAGSDQLAAFCKQVRPQPAAPAPTPRKHLRPRVQGFM